MTETKLDFGQNKAILSLNHIVACRAVDDGCKKREADFLKASLAGIWRTKFPNPTDNFNNSLSQTPIVFRATEKSPLANNAILPSSSFNIILKKRN